MVQLPYNTRSTVPVLNPVVNTLTFGYIIYNVVPGKTVKIPDTTPKLQPTGSSTATCSSLHWPESKQTRNRGREFGKQELGRLFTILLETKIQKLWMADVPSTTADPSWLPLCALR